MSDPIDLPRLPADRMRPVPRKVSELKTGEQAALSFLMNLGADENGLVWVDTSSALLDRPPLPGFILLAERTERGFILWLDNKIKFTRSERSGHKQYLPVVEFREAPQTED